MSETDAPPPVVAAMPGSPTMQTLSERVAKLDFVKVTIGLLVAVTLGGFTLLAMQISRVEGRISALASKSDTVSIKTGEIPSVFQRELQASTDKLAALINATRQMVSNIQPVPTRSEAQGSSPKSWRRPISLAQPLPT